MPYYPLDTTKPDQSTQNITNAFASIRQNDEALLDMLITLGMAPGWNYSWSGGTRDAPATMTWTKSTNSNVRVRAQVTYSGGLVDTMTFSKTVNGGTNWDKMTYDGKDRVTFTYVSGAVDSYTWSAT